MSSKKRQLLNNKQEPTAKKMKLNSDQQRESLMKLIKVKIQEIIDEGFLGDIDADSYINELTQYFNQINDDDKKEILNSSYNYYDYNDDYNCDPSYSQSLAMSLVCKISDYDYIPDKDSDNEKLSSNIKKVINFFTEHGMNLMSKHRNDYASYESFGGTQWVSLSFEIDMINKFSQHPFHTNYFLNNPQSLITINVEHYCGFCYWMTFADKLLFRRFTVHNVNKCITSLFHCDFFKLVSHTYNTDTYNHQKISKYKTTDVTAAINTLSKYINCALDAKFICSKIHYLFTITEMIKTYQAEILEVITQETHLILPENMIQIIGQYTLRDLSLFQNKAIQFDVWLLASFKSFIKFGPQEDGGDEAIQGWLDKFIHIIRSNDKYTIVLWQYIMKMETMQFVGFCFYYYVAQIMIKVLSFISNNASSVNYNRHHVYAQILIKLDQNFVNHGIWWGKFIGIVIKNIRCTCEQTNVVDTICDKILKHSGFKSNKEQQKKIMDSLSNEMETFDVNNLSGVDVKIQVSNRLAPPGANSFTFGEGKFGFPIQF